MWPTWMGPVGLTLTNSTMIFRGLEGWSAPKSSPAVRIFGHLPLEPLGTETEVEEAGRGDPDFAGTRSSVGMRLARVSAI